MIQGISFKAGISTDPTIKGQDTTFAQPQAYLAQPNAASGVSGDKFEKKSNKGKKIIGTLIGLVAAAGLLIAGHRKGFLAVKDLSTDAKFFTKVKHYVLKGLDTAGTFLDEKIYKHIESFIKGLKGKGGSDAPAPEAPATTATTDATKGKKIPKGGKKPPVKPDAPAPEAPVKLETPVTTEAPATIETPVATETPKATKGGKKPKAPKAPEAPATPETPAPAETPKATKGGKKAKATKAPEAPATPEAPAPAEAPKTP